MAKKSTLLIVALLCTAAAITACRREVPEPMGLGAASVPAASHVAK